MILLKSGCPSQVLAALLIALSALAAGCLYANFLVEVRPDSVVMLPGEQVNLTVSTAAIGNSGCNDPEDPTGGDLCADLPTDAVFDLQVHNLPDGITATLDTSLQSPSTPGSALITLAAAPDVEAGRYELSVIASFEGFQLGVAAVHVDVPASSEPLTNGDALAIGAGDKHSLVRHVDGLLAWGNNEYGQLGVGDRRQRNLPTGAATAPFGSMLAAGDAYSLSGISGAGWSVFSWGSNSDGQLGLGLPGFSLPFRTTPQEIPDLSNVVGLAAGSRHSLALDQDGAVWSWGENDCGQLGDGAPSTGQAFSRPSPTPVQGLPAVQAIAAGRRHSVALDLAANVWTWGHNGKGQLGDGLQRRPIGVCADGWRIDPPAPISDLTDVIGIATSEDYTLALRDDGSVWAWGDAWQLGLIRQGLPVQVVGLNGVAAVAAGSSHALALRSNGTVWAWGRDDSGQLGDGGPSISTLVPIEVPGLGNVVAIAAGRGHSMALLDCGQVWTWGDNAFGQLGVGDTDDRNTPTLVPGIGDESDCALVAFEVTETGNGSGWAASPDAPSGCDGLGQHDDLACSNWRVILLRGIEVDLSALAAEGSTFGGWGLDCAGASPDLTVTLDRSLHCTARFDDSSPAPVLLSVSTDGGTVTSSDSNVTSPAGPARIDCGEDCGALFQEGSVVDLHAGIGSGFELLSWGDDCEGSDPDIQITMDVMRQCSAAFRAFSLSLTLGPGGTVTSDPPGIACEAGICSFAPGVGQVTLTAVPDPGHELDAWGGDCSGSDLQTVIPMTSDQACTVSFRRIPGQYLLTMVVDGSGLVTSSPAGIACQPTCQALFPAGSIDLTATPATGWEVLHWLDDCAATGGQTNQILLDADKTCRVVFSTQAQEPVAEFFTHSQDDRSPAVGLIVTFDGSASHMLDPVTGNQDPNGITQFRWDFHNDGTIDAAGSRAAAAVVQYAFQIVGDQPVRLEVVGGPFDLVDEDVLTLSVAEGQQPLFGLSVAKAGTGQGTLVTSPLGLLSCGSACPGVGPLMLEAGTAVTLVATAAQGSHFVDWSGAGCDAATSTVTVDMTAARSCTATFDADATHTLNVEHDGGGEVTSEPAGIDCGDDCSEVYAHGTLVLLTATNDPGYAFDGWGGCDSESGDQCEVLVDATRTVTASFSEVIQSLWALTVVRDGSGTGYVASTNSGEIDCGADCSGSFGDGEIVELVATPDPGSQFSGWNGCDDVDGNLCTFSMVQDRTATATFVSSPTWTVTVTRDGTGSGHVGSIGTMEIDCGIDCSGEFEDGGSVALLANPDTGSTLAGWTGCESVHNDGYTCGVNGIHADRTVGVTFNVEPNQYDLIVTPYGAGTVTSQIPGIDCPGDCSEDHPAGTFLLLTATPDPGYQWHSWVGCDSTPNDQCAVTLNADRAVTVYFTDPTQPVLTLFVNGAGTVSSTPAGIDCGAAGGACLANFPAGTEVDLLASPGASVNWDFGCDQIVGADLCEVTMSLSRAVGATFP